MGKIEADPRAARYHPQAGEVVSCAICLKLSYFSYLLFKLIKFDLTTGLATCFVCKFIYQLVLYDILENRKNVATTASAS